MISDSQQVMAQLCLTVDRDEDKSGWQLTEDYVAQGSNAAHCPGDHSYPLLRYKFYSTITYGILIHIWARANKTTTTSGYPCKGYGSRDGGSGSSYFESLIFDYTSMKYKQGVGYTMWPSNYSFSSSTWYEFEVGLNPITDKKCAWKSGSYMGKTDLKSTCGDYTFSGFSRLDLYPGNDAHEDMWIDELFVRKWVELEPTHGVWGTEESL